MLLSLLSRRSLEGDSRDAYGFTVRPQHLQRYREYGNIYKEEEDERSGNWKNFLQQCEGSAQLLPFAEEHAPEAEATERMVVSSSEICQIGDDSAKGHRESATSAEVGADKVVHVGTEPKVREVQTWAPLGRSLAPIENMMSARVKKIVNSPNHQWSTSAKPSHSIGRGRCKTESSECNIKEHKLHYDTANHKVAVNDLGNADDSCGTKDKPAYQESEAQLLATERNANASSSCQVDVLDCSCKKDIPGYQKPEEEALRTRSNADSSCQKGVPCQNAVTKGETGEETVNYENCANDTNHEGDFYQKIGKQSQCHDKHATADSYPEREIKVDTEQTFAEGNAESNPLSSELFLPSKEELESLVRGGVPKSLRGEVWQAFVGVQTRRVEMYYQNLISAEFSCSEKKGSDEASKAADIHAVPEKLKKQIEKDLPRTFPGHPALDEVGRSSLRRILTVYARHNPSVGYCQAMNFFAGLLLLLMPEENAFWTLTGLIDEYFNGYYTNEMIESQVDQLVFEELMRERFPRLINHLDYLGVQVTWISGPWFLSIFVNILPWESVLRIWDVLLFEGNRVMLFRTALALMELYGPALLTTKEAGDAVILLQSLAGSTFDSSQLVLTACMGFPTVTETKLHELRNKHRPSVLAIIEERSKGTKVSKQSRTLATKLYSFKHGPQGVMKEASKTQRVRRRSGDIPLKKTTSSFDKLYCEITIDPEIDSVPDLQEQVVWLRGELCSVLEEKRMAALRAEELEAAFVEMVKHDNRLQLSAKVEQLEHEVSRLRKNLTDKEEQEKAMLEVLMRMELEQKVAEDARIAAEKEAARQRVSARVLQEKYDKVVASQSEMEKRVKMAESMLEATLQYQSGQAKAQSSPRMFYPESANGLLAKTTNMLPFGLSKLGKPSNTEDAEGSYSGRSIFRRQWSVAKSEDESKSPVSKVEAVKPNNHKAASMNGRN